MSALSALLLQAREEHRLGRWQAAEEIYCEILQLNPGHGEAQQLWGILRLQQGDYAAALALLEPLVSMTDQPADLWNQIGVAYHGLGQWEPAARAFQRAIRAQVDAIEPHSNLGRLMESRQMWAEAERCYQVVAQLQPQEGQPLRDLARAAQNQGKWPVVVECQRRRLELQPGDVEARVNLGFALIQTGELAEARGLYEALVREQPDFAEIHCNLGCLYERLGLPVLAEQSARRALELLPESAESYNNLGLALRAQGDLAGALAAFDRALQLQPDFPLARLNRGTTYLVQGDYERGWPDYEARLALIAPTLAEYKVWQGEVLERGRLRVFADQGFGDTLQFVRFLPAVRDQSQAEIVLECESALQRLLVKLPGVAQLVTPGTPLEADDVVCPISSLPDRLGIRLDQLPAATGYLTVPASSAEFWRERLPPAWDGQLAIGLAWQGNPAQARDRQRSCPLSELTALLDVPGARWFSLQRDDASQQQLQKEPAAHSIENLGAEITDFADTAAILSQLSLVITVDTAIAHLAGGLGIPTWVLVDSHPDWRWLSERSDSPWYPSIRLFRQTEPGNWRELLARVRSELLRWRESSDRSSP